MLLGGTTEASQLACALAEAGTDAVFSYAGRTAAPVAQPLQTRVGGFGGVAGLQGWLQAQRITQVVDATHPVAAQMSRNAVHACAAAGVPLLAFERPTWQAQAGDQWQCVADIAGAVAALPPAPARVFLAIGRQNLLSFAPSAQCAPHHYLLRLVDAPEAPPLPDCTVIVARGPFDHAADLALMQAHGITHLVAKNAGGAGAEAKITAARALRLPVILIERPALPGRHLVSTPEAVMAWLPHAETERGV